jgi:hypothetical protein
MMFILSIALVEKSMERQVFIWMKMKNLCARLIRVKCICGDFVLLAILHILFSFFSQLLSPFFHKFPGRPSNVKKIRVETPPTVVNRVTNPAPPPTIMNRVSDPPPTVANRVSDLPLAPPTTTTVAAKPIVDTRIDKNAGRVMNNDRIHIRDRI